MAGKYKGHVEHEGVHKKTSQGNSRSSRSFSKCMMNKNKRRSTKRYRGQGGLR